MSDAKQNAIPYYTKERCLKSAIAELIDDYEALKREANELRGHNKYLETRVSEESDYAELETRHNALWNFYNQLENSMYGFEKEARTERMKRVMSEKFTERYKEIATNAVELHTALVEAVKWERECNNVSWSVLCDNVNLCAILESGRTHRAARVEVDRLLEEGKK